MLKKEEPLNSSYILPADLPEFSQQAFEDISEDQISKAGNMLKDVFTHDLQILKPKRRSLNIRTTICLVASFIAINFFLSLALYFTNKHSIVMAIVQFYIFLAITMSPYLILILDKYESLRPRLNFNFLKPLFPNLAFSSQALLPFHQWSKVPPFQGKVLEFKNVFRAKAYNKIIDIGTVSFREPAYATLSPRKFYSFISIPCQQVGGLVITNHPPLWRPKKKIGLPKGRKLDWRLEDFVAYATNDGAVKFLERTDFISALYQLSQRYPETNISIFFTDIHTVVLIEKAPPFLDFSFKASEDVTSIIKNTRDNLLILIGFAKTLIN